MEKPPEPVPQSDTEKRRAEKIALVERSIGIEYSPEEQTSFDQWRERLPENTREKPLAVASIEEMLKLLPSSANYTGEDIRLFFTKEGFSDEELENLMSRFSGTDPSFEISLIRSGDQHVEIGIGNKTRHFTRSWGGEYFAHSHPMHLYQLPNPDNMPHCFLAGVMPSSGDARAYCGHPQSIMNGTRIFSRAGYSLIRPIEGIEAIPPGMEEFQAGYLDLFLGENKFGFITDAEVARYFREKLGLEVEFHYRAQST